LPPLALCVWLCLVAKYLICIPQKLTRPSVKIISKDNRHLLTQFMTSELVVRF
jgi:hypothetical protein